mmetsp:Transcript_20575/g.30625  ORF Transcript_20575/g.30625 Transcript_20575/m.30625 type:complete len:210 (-) Transcript_20575:283-912(-)
MVVFYAFKAVAFCDNYGRHFTGKSNRCSQCAARVLVGQFRTQIVSSWIVNLTTRRRHRTKLEHIPHLLMIHGAIEVSQILTCSLMNERRMLLHPPTEQNIGHLRHQICRIIIHTSWQITYLQTSALQRRVKRHLIAYVLTRQYFFPPFLQKLSTRLTKQYSSTRIMIIRSVKPFRKKIRRAFRGSQMLLIIGNCVLKARHWSINLHVRI